MRGGSRRAGIGYLNYAINSDILQIIRIEYPSCKTGRIIFPIKLRPDSPDCVVGPPMVR